MKTIRMTEPSKLVHSSVPDHQPAAGGIAARARAAAGGPKYLAGLNPATRGRGGTQDRRAAHGATGKKTISRSGRTPRRRRRRWETAPTTLSGDVWLGVMPTA